MGQVLIAALAVGTQVAGGVLQARAAQAEGDAVASAAEYNRVRALQQGRAEERRRRRVARRELSSQRVAFAKAGVTLEGSPLALLGQNAAEFEVDALNVGAAARNTANLERMRARSARRIGRRRAGAELLGGVARGASLGAQLF
jgi:hypothetical protein